MKGYWVCIYEKIDNEEKQKEYALKARPAVEKFSGKVIARGGKILFITDNKKESLNENIRFGLRVPHVDNLLSPILLTLPLQMLAYNVALLKNCDVDKPRNLAKSVTVE